MPENDDRFSHNEIYYDVSEPMIKRLRLQGFKKVKHDPCGDEYWYHPDSYSPLGVGPPDLDECCQLWAKTPEAKEWCKLHLYD